MFVDDECAVFCVKVNIARINFVLMNGTANTGPSCFFFASTCRLVDDNRYGAVVIDTINLVYTPWVAPLDGVFTGIQYLEVLSGLNGLIS